MSHIDSLVTGMLVEGMFGGPITGASEAGPARRFISDDECKQAWMQQTNTFAVRPRSDRERRLFVELLDASAACYNEVNSDRRQAHIESRSDD